MATPLSQTLIRTSHPSLCPTESSLPTSRVSRLLKLVHKLSEQDDVISIATVNGWPSSPNFVNRKLGSFLYRVEKFMQSYGYKASRPSETHQASRDSQLMHLEPDGIKISSSKQTCDIGHLQSTCDTRVKQFTAHEGKMLIRFPAMALIITHSLMLSTPFVALAETCEANESVFNMPLLLFVALVGATVGGLVARQRKGELQRVNEQLRQINASLRRQAKIESYAPALSYAPVGGGRVPESEVIVDPKKEELISRLKTGKNFLRNQDRERAFVEFKAALDLAQIIEDPVEEKKAARGLGASLQRQGKYREAIKYHSMVLDISERVGEDSGNTEAYGAIADCYTELGDLERAGKFYDNYIARLEKD